MNAFVRKINQGLDDLSRTIRNTPGIANRTGTELSKAIRQLSQGLVSEARPIVEAHVRTQLDAEDMRRATELWSKKLEKSNEAIAVTLKNDSSLKDLVLAFPDIADQIKHLKMLPDGSPNKFAMTATLLKVS